MLLGATWLVRKGMGQINQPLQPRTQSFLRGCIRAVWPIIQKCVLGNLSPVENEKPHESNLVWGPVGIGCSIVLAVVAAMKHDLRFLFVVAWPCFIFGLWRLCKFIRYRRFAHVVVVISGLGIGIGLWLMAIWLRPDAIVARREVATHLPSNVVMPAPEPAEGGRDTPPPLPAKLSKLSPPRSEMKTKKRLGASEPSDKKQDTTANKGHEQPILIASLVTPSDPSIVVENIADTVADDINWELVMFRIPDHAFCSYSTQKIGYVKGHSKSASYTMSLNAIGHAPQTPRLMKGDKLVGSISIDCAKCDGTTLIVSFNWEMDGWYYRLPDSHGGLYLPKGMTDAAVDEYVSSIERVIPAQLRQPIR